MAFDLDLYNLIIKDSNEFAVENLDSIVGFSDNKIKEFLKISNITDKEKASLYINFLVEINKISINQILQNAKDIALDNELKQAQATKARVEAEIALATKDAQIELTKAQADKAKADAQKAKAEAQIALATKDAQIELILAQAEKEKAGAQKIKAEIEKIPLEIEILKSEVGIKLKELALKDLELKIREKELAYKDIQLKIAQLELPLKEAELKIREAELQVKLIQIEAEKARLAIEKEKIGLARDELRLKEKGTKPEWEKIRIEKELAKSQARQAEADAGLKEIQASFIDDNIANDMIKHREELENRLRIARIQAGAV